MTQSTSESFQAFVAYRDILDGDEKGEAQVFCDRLFQAFGHDGYKEAGAKLEYRIKDGKVTKYADLFWLPRLLIEMKSVGENLEKHYDQAFGYWLNLTPQRPAYVVLCNFDEFWIFDFNVQLHSPVDVVKIIDLPHRYTALNFLFPKARAPLFQNDLVAVSRSAAENVGKIFRSIIASGEDREVAQRFVLQCVLAMFSEDYDLLPRGLFSEIVMECVEGQSTYDLIGQLFHQMNNQEPAKGGRYKDVPYFDGGIFEKIEPVELSGMDLINIKNAANEDWSKINPAIVGTLFQSTMEEDQRHKFGAHFTSEADIQKVVRPCIFTPWLNRIDEAEDIETLVELRNELLEFRTLDPACGSGNFLYLAYRELSRLDIYLIAKIHELASSDTPKFIDLERMVEPSQMFGIDKLPFAVELAKVTLVLSKEMGIRDMVSKLDQLGLPVDGIRSQTLPLDNLDKNFLCEDALFNEWFPCDAIIGNPPYQSKNKMVEEFGEEYVSSVRDAFPDVPGRADYCVYWFRKAHDHLEKGCRAGLVGTNTITQTYSRQGGLDYIVNNGGAIFDAVKTQVWSGEAVVHVSIVNWIKGELLDKAWLTAQTGDHRESDWVGMELDRIPSNLSFNFDVTEAKKLETYADCPACYQGQTPGCNGFLLRPAQALTMKKDANAASVIFPYYIGNDLLGHPHKFPSRYIIDMQGCDDIQEASQKGKAFKHIQQDVLPEVTEKAEKQRKKTGRDTGDRINHLNYWWKFWRPRPELIGQIRSVPRYIVCVRVTKRPIFEFVSNEIRPGDALQVFVFSDDYSFGILSSGLHWKWFVETCSTLKREPRYTSNTVFDTFPWPQTPSEKQVHAVAEAGRELRRTRNELLKSGNTSLREIYRILELPGNNVVASAQETLDEAVLSAYGISDGEDELEFLLNLNLSIAEKEAKEEKIQGPGVPSSIKEPATLMSDDCVTMPSDDKIAFGSLAR